MEQAGEYRIRAGLDDVWSGLNDPEILGRCIDGCQSMEKVSDDRFETSVKARVGPVSATFQAVLELSDVDPPSSYTINANVKGGAAGFGKGAAIELAPAPIPILTRRMECHRQRMTKCGCPQSVPPPRSARLASQAAFPATKGR